MELTASSITGAVRIGVQIVSTAKYPVLEFYCSHLARVSGQERLTGGLSRSGVQSSFREESLDQFVQFSIANIGSTRAENVQLKHQSDIKIKGKPIDFGGLFSEPIDQILPGQTYHLFRIIVSDLMIRNQQTKLAIRPVDTQMEDFLTGEIELYASYDLPPGLMNWLKTKALALVQKFKSRTDGRYALVKYRFKPMYLAGSYPPIDYN